MSEMLRILTLWANVLWIPLVTQLGRKDHRKRKEVETLRMDEVMGR